MVNGRGYLIAYSLSYPGDLTKKFQGEILDGNQSLPVTMSENNWNLAGNPYPCGLDWSSDGVDKSLAGGNAMYVWDKNINYPAGGYRTHNGTTGVPASTSPIVPAMNGFMVYSTGNGSVDVDISVDEPLVISDQSFYKNFKDPVAGMRFTVARGEFTDEAMVSFDEAFHDQLMDSEDARKLFRSHPEIPEIFSLYEEGMLVINNVSDNYPEIKIGYTSSYQDTLSLHFSGMETCNPNYNIWLLDKHLNLTISLLEENNYSFVTDSGFISDRFSLKFTDDMTIHRERTGYQPITIVYNQKSVRINNPERISGLIQVLDLRGRILINTKLNNSLTENIILDFPPGIYILAIRTTMGINTWKILTQ